MTDYASLPSSVLAKIEDPSVNTVAIQQIDLDARIAAAFAHGAKSNDVATLIKDTEHGAASASGGSGGVCRYLGVYFDGLSPCHPSTGHLINRSNSFDQGEIESSRGKKGGGLVVKI